MSVRIQRGRGLSDETKTTPYPTLAKNHLINTEHGHPAVVAHVWSTGSASVLAGSYKSIYLMTKFLIA